MRFVAVKSEAAQANAVVFRARDLLVRQRTQAINALRGHLGEYGLVAAKGPGHVTKLIEHVEDPASSVPEAARLVLRTLIDSLRFLSERIDLLDREIARRAREDSEVKRLTSIPGVGPITATALAALAPPASAFRKGRDFAAWVGLTPLQHSTGGKQKLGATSKMGERTLRRLLIIGASSVVRMALRQGVSAESLAREDAGSQAQDARDRGPCQQDGPHRLGATGQGRDLSDSRCGGLKVTHSQEASAA